MVQVYTASYSWPLEALCPFEGEPMDNGIAFPVARLPEGPGCLLDGVRPRLLLPPPYDVLFYFYWRSGFCGGPQPQLTLEGLLRTHKTTPHPRAVFVVSRMIRMSSC